MTYQNDEHRGLKKIADKIESFGFTKIIYKINFTDVQEGPIPGSFLVFVSGYLQMDGNDEFRFSQVFNVVPNGSGGLYVHNDIFSVIF